MSVTLDELDGEVRALTMVRLCASVLKQMTKCLKHLRLARFALAINLTKRLAIADWTAGLQSRMGGSTSGVKSFYL